jgi:hypothetical protein
VTPRSRTDVPALAAERAGRISRLTAEHAVPGVVIAPLSGTEIWLAGFGRTARDGGTPVGGLTAFSRQSSSETFTALTAPAEA